MNDEKHRAEKRGAFFIPKLSGKQKGGESRGKSKTQGRPGEEAGHAAAALGLPFPVVGLSRQAITTILGVNALKVVENIFEHNSGPIFGHSDSPLEGTEGVE